MYSKHFINKF
jgi:hypothetical protein